MSGLGNPIALTASDLVSANSAPGIYIHINCTVAGNVSITAANGTDTLQVAVGSSFFPIGVIRVNSTGTTATATYKNYYR
jgi:hypothetical protein